MEEAEGPPGTAVRRGRPSAGGADKRRRADPPGDGGAAGTAVTKRLIGVSQMTRRWRVGLVVVGLVVLGGAPTAEAAKPHSTHGVVVHLRSADRAIARLVAGPAGPAAGMYLARADQQARLAAGIARSIVLAGHGGASGERAATVLGLFADHQTSEAQTLTSVLGSVRPELQADVARAISADTGGRGVVLGMLSGLLPTLSAKAQPIFGQVVTLESSQGAQVPVELAGVLGGSALPCSATGAVQQALVVSTQAFQLGLANLGPALALVPPRVRAQVQSEIDGIPALLRHIEEQLASAVPCSGGPAAPGQAPVAAIQAPALLGGMTELIDGILGRLLPGLGAGRTPAPVAAPAPLAGLLGGVGSLFGSLLPHLG